MNKADFEYKEWLALKYAQDWVVLGGEEPQGPYIADYESHYSKEQRDYIHKVMRMMRFTNNLANTWAPKSSRSQTARGSAARIIKNREYSGKEEFSEGNKDHADVVAPPPLILGIVLAAGLLLHKYVPLLILGHASALFKTMGNALFLISALMMVPTTVLMIRHKTALSPYKPTTALVTSGLFRYSRNPLYVALLMIYGGVTLHANSLWMLFLAPVLFVVLDRVVVVPEEEYLGRTCGDEYVEYKKKVRRWI